MASCQLVNANNVHVGVVRVDPDNGAGERLDTIVIKPDAVTRVQSCTFTAAHTYAQLTGIAVPRHVDQDVRCVNRLSGHLNLPSYG